MLIRAQWKCFCHMTGRNKDCQPPGTGVNLHLGPLGLWDSLQLREFFTVKWNTLSFGVNKMCTYKIWKGCMIAGDSLTAVSICCQEC